MRLARTIGIFTLAVSLAACGSGSSSAASSSSSASSTGSSSGGSMGSSSSAPAGGSMTNASQPFGSACSQVPASGAGSFSGMATAPVGTAASNNPVLSTLVQAVQKANLVDTLNTTQNITVFAPANPAFSAIPADQLNAVLANTPQLTQLLGNLTQTSQLLATHRNGIEQLMVTYPAAAGGGYSVVPGDHKAHFGLVINQFNPLPCTAGYQGTQPRAGNDTRPSPLNTGAHCAEPPNSPTDVRGARNAPGN